MELESAYEKSDKTSVFDKIDLEFKKFYDIKFNEVGLEYDIFNLSTSKKIDFNEASLLIHLHREQISERSQHLKTYLKSHFVKKYNPIIEYFENLPVWDGKDYIQQFASYVKTDNDQLFAKHMLKWAVRAVKTVFEKHQINKNCLVLANGDQNAGKSTYLNYLCPDNLREYHSTNVGVSKDDRIKLCKTFLINIEEIDDLGRNSMTSLKSTISQVTVNERLPYDTKSSLLYRICSFTASTNETEILTDETGSVRWIVFDVQGKINWDYSKEFDINNFWSHAYHIYKHCPEFKSDLSESEVSENERRNEKFTNTSVEAEFVLKYYEATENPVYFRTATEVCMELNVLGLKLNNGKIGSAFKKFGFSRVKHSKRQVYGYLAKQKFKDTPYGFTD